MCTLIQFLIFFVHFQCHFFCPSVLMARGAHGVHKKHLECAESAQSLFCAHCAHCALSVHSQCIFCTFPSLFINKCARFAMSTLCTLSQHLAHCAHSGWVAFLTVFVFRGPLVQEMQQRAASRLSEERREPMQATFLMDSGAASEAGQKGQKK
jgi:hypothetical protein